MGYPSRAVFKLLEAQKKHNVIRPGDVVVDLGCSPGSWSKLASNLAQGHGFVLGMDLTKLSPAEQQALGVRLSDVDRSFDHPRSFHHIKEDSALLPSEKKLLRARAPVGIMHQDVTTWQIGPGFSHGVDVILSDMAPKTTGMPSADSAESMDLCYHVIDLCSKLFKPPSTKSEAIHNQSHKQEILKALKTDVNNENVVVDHLKIQHEINMMKKHKLESIDDIDKNKPFDLKVLKKTLKQHAYLKNRNTMGLIEDGEEQSAVYKTGEHQLSQIQGRELFTTTWRGALMMKVFQGEGFTDMMNILRQIFVSTYTFKPQSSRSESVEIFVICKGYCGPFDDTRITNKHIRRPKTFEYLQQYKSNNKKRPAPAYDPTKHVKFQEFVPPAMPQQRQNAYAAARKGKQRFSSNMSIDDIYASMGIAENDLSYTSDAFVEHQKMEEVFGEYETTARQTIARGVSTNVHAAIKNASAREVGEMTPLQREISESDDIVVYQQQQFDDLFGEGLETNKVLSPQDIARTMSLYWDEGINFAKKVSVVSQTPVRHDIFQKAASVQELIRRDTVDAMVYEDGMTKIAPAEMKDTTSASASGVLDDLFNDEDLFEAKKTTQKKATTKKNTTSLEDDAPQSSSSVKKTTSPKKSQKVALTALISDVEETPHVEDVKTKKTPRVTTKQKQIASKQTAPEQTATEQSTTEQQTPATTKKIRKTKAAPEPVVIDEPTTKRTTKKATTTSKKTQKSEEEQPPVPPAPQTPTTKKVTKKKTTTAAEPAPLDPIVVEKPKRGKKAVVVPEPAAITKILTTNSSVVDEKPKKTSKKKAVVAETPTPVVVEPVKVTKKKATNKSLEQPLVEETKAVAPLVAEKKTKQTKKTTTTVVAAEVAPTKQTKAKKTVIDVAQADEMAQAPLNSTTTTTTSTTTTKKTRPKKSD